MTDKVQKIREEVERLFNHVKDSNFESDSGAFYYLKDLLDYIDSLQEEPVSEELEEEITKCYKSRIDLMMTRKQFGEIIHRFTNWQKRQMMKDAVNGIVHNFGNDEIAAVHYNDPKGVPMSYFVSSKCLNAGDKVKLIIIKED